MALNKYTKSRRFSQTTTIDRAQAVVPENSEYKLFRKGRVSNQITESQSEKMIQTGDYKVGKSGNVYHKGTGENVAKGFQSFYTPPKNISSTQLPNDQNYQSYRNGKNTPISEKDAKKMIGTKKYKVGKSGAIYDVKTGELSGKGFQSFYTPPEHIPYSQMGSRVKGK